MTIPIYIPTALRPYTDNKNMVAVDGRTVGQCLQQFLELYPGLKKHLLNDQGKLRNFVNIYLNDEDIRYLQQEDTAVKDGDELNIIPSVAGGSPLPPLSNDEIQRYSRHLLIPEVRLEGQRKLKNAGVLLIGAGGLGSPAALYLAAAGVGHLGLVDFDVVDKSNLQRQILHGESQIGRSKLDSARDRLLDLNSEIEISTFSEALSSQNALRIIEGFDLIVDGTDNFPTRYLVNDACVLSGKKNVYGSIFRFEGQVSIFGGEDGPCYRCLYPEPPPPGLVPSCAEGGVLGVLPGIIGTIQAAEAIKTLLGIGENLSGKLLLFDALNMTFKKLTLKRNTDCPVCGSNSTIHELIDYQQFCGLPGDDHIAKTEWDITAEELAAEMNNGRRPVLIDVRELPEYEICRLPGARLVPLRELPLRLHELNSADDIVLYCKMGQRSLDALKFLQDAGFRKVRHLQDGILAWAAFIDPDMPVY